MARIILADDDPLFAAVVCNALVAEGYAVSHCIDGAEALALLRLSAPHLFILDCNMPGLSGIDVLRELRRRDESRDVPVLMLTARNSPADERIARFDGAQDYLSKPVHIDELMVTVAALLKPSTRGCRIDAWQNRR